MAIFFRVFIKIFAFLSSIVVFFILFGLIVNFFNKNINSDIFIYKKGNADSINKIAILKLNGPIINEQTLFHDIDFLKKRNYIYVSEIKKLLHILKSEKIKGLIISINSPGGSVSASYSLYNLFEDFKNNNEIKIFFHTNELLASGAYWASLAGNKIFANYGSLIGSVGVKGPDWIYFDGPHAISTGLFGNSIQTKNGIKKFNNIAGNSKDIFDPFRPPTKKEIMDLQNTVQNIYKDFVNTVSKKRKIETDVVLNDIGAMIYDNKTAKEKFLIDDTANLEIVIQKMVDYLDIENFQIIEKENYELGFFQKLIEINSLSNNYLDYTTKYQADYICSISKFGLSAMIIQNKLITEC